MATSSLAPAAASASSSSDIPSSHGGSVAVSGSVPLSGVHSYVWPDGDKYEGEWSNGAVHGEGTYHFRNGDRYVGEFKNGKRDGQGVCYFVSGNRYEGEYREGRKNGKGVFFYVNGDRYDGQWRDDKKNGHGSYTFADGDRYEGDWKDDKKNGRGTYTFVSGSRYEGEWKGDKKHGQGTYHYKSLDRYEGEWKEGKMQGKGKYYTKDGSWYEGVWENDKCVQKTSVHHAQLAATQQPQTSQQQQQQSPTPAQAAAQNTSQPLPAAAAPPINDPTVQAAAANTASDSKSNARESAAVSTAPLPATAAPRGTTPVPSPAPSSAPTMAQDLKSDALPSKSAVAAAASSSMSASSSASSASLSNSASGSASSFSSMSSNSISKSHGSHPHPLQYTASEDYPECDGCLEAVDATYSCNSCNYHLCANCIADAGRIDSSHPHWLWTRDGEGHCDQCQNIMIDNFFSCKKCQFDLCAECMDKNTGKVLTAAAAPSTPLTLAKPPTTASTQPPIIELPRQPSFPAASMPQSRPQSSAQKAPAVLSAPPESKSSSSTAATSVWGQTSLQQPLTPLAPAVAPAPVLLQKKEAAFEEKEHSPTSAGTSTNGIVGGRHPWDDVWLATSALDPMQHFAIVVRSLSAPTTRIALSGHNGRVNDLLALPGEALLASASDDGTVKLWQAQLWKCVATLKGHREPVIALRALSSGRLLSASSAGAFIIWDVRSRTQLASFRLPHASAAPAQLLSVDLMDSGRALCYSSDGVIRVLALRTGEVEHSIMRAQLQHHDQIYGAASLGDGLIATYSADRSVQVHHVRSGMSMYRFDHSSAIKVLLPMSEHRVAVADGKAIKVWDINTGNGTAYNLPHSISRLIGFPSSSSATSPRQADVIDRNSVSADGAQRVLCLLPSENSVGIFNLSTKRMERTWRESGLLSLHAFATFSTQQIQRSKSSSSTIAASAAADAADDGDEFSGAADFTEEKQSPTTGQRARRKGSKSEAGRSKSSQAARKRSGARSRSPVRAILSSFAYTASASSSSLPAGAGAAGGSGSGSGVRSQSAGPGYGRGMNRSASAPLAELSERQKKLFDRLSKPKPLDVLAAKFISASITDCRECTFKPHISETSQALASDMPRFFQRLEQYVARFIEAHNQEPPLDPNATFQPHINHRILDQMIHSAIADVRSANPSLASSAATGGVGLGGAKSAANHDADLVEFLRLKFLDRMFKDVEKRKRTKETLALQSEYSFQPEISETSKKKAAKIKENFLQRLERDLAMRDENLRSKQDAYEEEHVKKFPFKPNVNRHQGPAPSFNGFLSRMLDDVEERNKKERQRLKMYKLLGAIVNANGNTKKEKKSSKTKSQQQEEQNDAEDE